MKMTGWLLVSIPFITVMVYLHTRDIVLFGLTVWILIFIVELIKSVLNTIKES